MEKAACRRLERASRHSLDLLSLLLSFLHVGLSRLNTHCNNWRGCVLVLSCGGLGVFRAQLLPSSVLWIRITASASPKRRASHSHEMEHHQRLQTA